MKPEGRFAAGAKKGRKRKQPGGSSGGGSGGSGGGATAADLPGGSAQASCFGVLYLRCKGRAGRASPSPLCIASCCLARMLPM